MDTHVISTHRHFASMRVVGGHRGRSRVADRLVVVAASCSLFSVALEYQVAVVVWR